MFLVRLAQQFRPILFNLILWSKQALVLLYASPRLLFHSTIVQWSISILVILTLCFLQALVAPCGLPLSNWRHWLLGSVAQKGWSPQLHHAMSKYKAALCQRHASSICREGKENLLSLRALAPRRHPPPPLPAPHCHPSIPAYLSPFNTQVIQIKFPLLSPRPFSLWDVIQPQRDLL